MDMIYNFMVKNDVKVEKKTDVKEEKVRKTRKDKEGRKFICGCPGKPGYLSYPALYTHIKTKHNGVAPEGTIRGESGKPKKRGRPKVVNSWSYVEKGPADIREGDREKLVSKRTIEPGPEIVLIDPRAVLGHRGGGR